MTTVYVLLIVLTVLVTLLAAGVAVEINQHEARLERLHRQMRAMASRIDRMVDR